jgi:fibronectin-binding autotransporter adhesin
MLAQSTWTRGAGTDLWGTAGNWDVAPTTGSSIILNRTTTSTVALDVSIPSLTNWTSNIATAGTVVTSSGGNRTLTISGTLTKTGNNTLTFRDNPSGPLGLSMTVGVLDLSAANAGIVTFGSVTQPMTSLNITTANVTGNNTQLLTLGYANTANLTIGTLNLAVGASVVTANGGAAGQQYALNVGSLNGAGGVIRAANTTGTQVGTLNLTGTSNGSYSGSIVDGSAITRVVKSGTATQTLSNAGNNYTGGTQISGGTLLIATNNSIGAASGAVDITGANQAKLQINSGISVANNIRFSNTNAASSVELTLINGGNFRTGTSGNLTSNFAGGTPDTTALFLGGSTTAVRTLSMAFSGTSAATNDSIRKSDVFELTGSASDTFVLQLNATGLAASDYLGWLDGGFWVSAVSGNTGAGALAGFYGSTYAAFVAGNGGSFNSGTMLGAYGNDGAGNAWAVLNHNSDFTIIPEPSTYAMLLGGLGMLVWLRRSTRPSTSDKA